MRATLESAASGNVSGSTFPMMSSSTAASANGVAIAVIAGHRPLCV
jgi:hypothetical protein